MSLGNSVFVWFLCTVPTPSNQGKLTFGKLGELSKVVTYTDYPLIAVQDNDNYSANGHWQGFPRVNKRVEPKSFM